MAFVTNMRYAPTPFSFRWFLTVGTSLCPPISCRLKSASSAARFSKWRITFGRKAHGEHCDHVGIQWLSHLQERWGMSKQWCATFDNIKNFKKEVFIKLIWWKGTCWVADSPISTWRTWQQPLNKFPPFKNLIRFYTSCILFSKTL